MKDVLYDRQLRLWGEEGQSSIEASSVCVIGSSALASEILKSLILAGIKSFCIIDDAVVTMPDLGQNFFIQRSELGKHRAEVVTHYLKELRDSVIGEYIIQSPYDVRDEVLDKLLNFSVVVTTNVSDQTAMKISSRLFPANVPFITARVYGLLGYIRVSANEHTIANNHNEHLKPDLRLDMPFETLAKFIADSPAITDLTIEDARHTPYLILYFKALQDYRLALKDPNAFPSNSKERNAFLSTMNDYRNFFNSEKTIFDNFNEAKAAVYRCLTRTTIPIEVQEILSNSRCNRESKCQEPFWIICTALRRFVERHFVLPLAGGIPDMTSDSVRYTKLAALYHEQAIIDANEVFELTKEVESERDVGDLISSQQCYNFCKNAAKIRFMQGTPIGQENLNDIVRSIAAADNDEVSLSMWLLLLKASDLFYHQKMRYPGTNGVPWTIDAFDLKQRIKVLINESEISEKDRAFNKIPSSAIDEICRYGASEPHVVASLVGGIAAQEVIKLATNQYVPVSNAILFDGHTQQTHTFEL
ncbi:unnamed protein product [Auanema sp. JU1783]|nr:unnamed protein product [Auanema sp. JU1783]